MYFCGNEQYELSALIVDDSVVMRRIIFDILSPIIKDIDKANDGQIALNMIENKSYDIILTDINMPHVDGIQLVKTLRAQGIETPIFVISSESDQKYFIELINSNISGFLAKPPVPDTVKKLIHRLCTSIIDRRLVTEYQHQLQQRNEELERINAELLRSTKIMDKKNQSFAYAVSNQETSEEYDYFDQLREDDCENLYNYIASIDHHAVKLFASFNELSYTTISNALESISLILSSYIDFSSLGEEMKKFEEFLKEKKELAMSNHEDISYAFGSFSSTFKTFLDYVWKTKAKHPNIYDTALTNEIASIQSHFE